MQLDSGLFARHKTVCDIAIIASIGNVVINDIPQGSVLDILLYINDLPEQISFIWKLFPDDSKLYYSRLYYTI